MASSDIFQLTTRAHVVGKAEALLNVFHFQQTSASGSATDLIEAFEDDLFPDIQLIQSPKIEYESIEAVNLFTVDDFDVKTFDPGEQLGTSSAGDMLPVFNSITFRLVRTSRDIRNGYKRFAGIPESVQADGLITDSGYIDNMNALATALAAPVEAATPVGTYSLVVVKRIFVPADPPDKPKDSYRLPLNLGEAEWSNPSRVLVNLFVTHQTSRGN